MILSSHGSRKHLLSTMIIIGGLKGFRRGPLGWGLRNLLTYARDSRGSIIIFDDPVCIFPTLWRRREWGGGGRGNGPSFRPLQSYAPQLFQQKAAHIPASNALKVKEMQQIPSPPDFCSWALVPISSLWWVVREEFCDNDCNDTIDTLATELVYANREQMILTPFWALFLNFWPFFGPLALDRSAEQNWFCRQRKDGVAARSAPSRSIRL